MISRREVHCGADKPAELVIGVDTVYKRYNIHQYSDSEGIEGWEYDEDELTLPEYFREAFPEGQAISEAALGEFSIILAEYQEQVDATLGELSILLEEALANV